MRIWLKAQGFPPEPVQPSTQRTFDYGDTIEWLLFDSLTIPSSHEESGFKKVGDWWKTTETIREPSTGLIFSPAKSPIQDRQKEVEVGGFKGHIDGWADIEIVDGAEAAFKLDAIPTLVDSKSANGFSYDRAAFEDLEADVFKREYVITQNLYMEGMKLLRGILVFVNKEVGQMMFRLLQKKGELVAEGMERLNWSLSKAEPEPDFKWEKGGKLPLRCSYCEQKVNCAMVRNMPIIGPEFDKRGKPSWRVA